MMDMLSDVVLFTRLAPLVVWLAAVLALSTAGAVIAERTLFAIREARRRRFEARYVPLVRRALERRRRRGSAPSSPAPAPIASGSRPCSSCR